MRHYRRLSGLTVKACAALSAWPEAVVADSHVRQRFYQQIGYHPRRWEVIPNGVDTG